MRIDVVRHQRRKRGIAHRMFQRRIVIAENLDQTQPIRFDVNARPARCLGGRAALDGGDEVGAALQNFKLRSEEHTSELQSLMRISYAVFCFKKKIKSKIIGTSIYNYYK